MEECFRDAETVYYFRPRNGEKIERSYTPPVTDDVEGKGSILLCCSVE